MLQVAAEAHDIFEDRPLDRWTLLKLTVRLLDS